MLGNRNLYTNIYILAANTNIGVYPPNLVTSWAIFAAASVKIKQWPSKELLLRNTPPCIQLMTGADIPNNGWCQGILRNAGGEKRDLI